MLGTFVKSLFLKLDKGIEIHKSVEEVLARSPSIKKSKAVDCIFVNGIVMTLFFKTRLLLISANLIRSNLFLLKTILWQMR